MNATLTLPQTPQRTRRDTAVHRPVLLCIELPPHVVWVSRSLRRQGADARRAITMEHAERLVSQRDLDGVILNAPFQDCSHLIDVLHAVNPDTPVFALPGRDSDALRLCEMDCAVVLPKPINERELWESVRPLVQPKN